MAYMFKLREDQMADLVEIRTKTKLSLAKQVRDAVDMWLYDFDKGVHSDLCKPGE